MTITAAEFARLCKVSRPAVSKAPPSRIVKLPDGRIDTDNPVNAVYLAEHCGNPVAPVAPAKRHKAKASKPTAKPKTEPKKIKPATTETQGDPLPNLDDDLDPVAMAEWTVRDKRASALYKEAAERKLALDHLKKKEDLVPRPLFIAAVQGMNKAIDDHLHRLPAKLGPVLFAMARQTDATELAVIRELEHGMGEAIRRAVEDIARLAP